MGDERINMIVSDVLFEPRCLVLVNCGMTQKEPKESLLPDLLHGRHRAGSIPRNVVDPPRFQAALGGAYTDQDALQRLLDEAQREINRHC